MSYEFYKAIHLLSLIIVCACLGIGFFANPEKKWARNLGMTASFLLFVAGMGLLARLGVGHGQGWPLWVKLKLALWLVLSAFGPILTKRLKTKRTLAFFSILALFAVAVVLAINQPV